MYAEAAALISSVVDCRCCRRQMPAAEIAICDECLGLLEEDDGDVADSEIAVHVLVGTDEITTREVRYSSSCNAEAEAEDDVPVIAAPSQMTPEDAAGIEAEAARERHGNVCGTCVTRTDGVCSRRGCGRRCCACCMDETGLCPMCEEV